MKDAVGESVSVRVGGHVQLGESGPSSAPPARPSPSTASSRPTSRAPTTRPPTATTRSAACRSWPRATRSPRPSSTPTAHATKPPARYTEASLVKELEDREIGRPSTYASIIGTILDRGYVFKKGTALVPSFLAFAVVNLLEQHFGHLVDYDFTAAHGGRPRRDRPRRGRAGAAGCSRFYFGVQRRPRA